MTRGRVYENLATQRLKSDRAVRERVMRASVRDLPGPVISVNPAKHPKSGPVHPASPRRSPLGSLSLVQVRLESGGTSRPSLVIAKLR